MRDSSVGEYHFHLLIKPQDTGDMITFLMHVVVTPHVFECV